MSKDKREAIVDEIIDSIMAFPTSKDEEEWVNRFNTVKYSDKKHCIGSIIKSQDMCIFSAILEKHDVEVPKIGQFKIKPIREELVNYEKELINECGKNVRADLTEDEKEDIKLKMSNKARQLIANKKKTKVVNIFNPKIVNNFCKKD